MRILLLVHSFNSLSQRLFLELRDHGHDVAVEFDIHGDVTRDAITRFAPDLLLAPFLKRAIAEDIWRSTLCWIVHPGPVGDRGPSSLDRAILEGRTSWGVTVLEAVAEMDAGPVWSSREFLMRLTSKGSLYRHEVSEAAVEAVLEALDRLAIGRFQPEPIPQGPGGELGTWRPYLVQQKRAIDWQRDSWEAILRKINASDGAPGVRDTWQGREVYLYEARQEENLSGDPGTFLARRGPALCRATVDGALWIGRLREREGLHTFKRPATVVFPELAESLPENGESWDIHYREDGWVGHLSFSFYNGAMGVEACERLLVAYETALKRPTRVLVLWGGEDFWSNGMDLYRIEEAESPAEESWRNIQALNDLARCIIETDSHLVVSALQGNAGAGGVFLARAADAVWARTGVVLNPHYKDMGNLYGSEYWTYLLPRYAGVEAAARIQAARLPMGTREAHQLGLVDERFGKTLEDFGQETESRAKALAEDLALPNRLAEKKSRRDRDEAEKPLAQYREEELQRMHLSFFGFDPSYHVARFNFVQKVPKSRTPTTIALHRDPAFFRGEGMKEQGIEGELLRVQGVVQGVGFRPTVWRLAFEEGLRGRVWNDAEGVGIELWGVAPARDVFKRRLLEEVPPLARIESVTSLPLTTNQAPEEFTIAASVEGSTRTGVPPDAATCPACLQEAMDPLNRRYGYPFTNCTHCGPRLSIIRTIPYDRPGTSMDAFPMCPECLAEYRDPADRRFHAQPNACASCGPQVWLEDSQGTKIEASNPIAVAAERIQQGAIVAVKGLGGFHLAVDAGDEAAVQRLRQRKNRPHKPLAIMARDLAMASAYTEGSPEAEELLASPAAPIVLLPKVIESSLAPSVAPDQSTLGLMLPYTPLHHLLMALLQRPIVLTSGNRSDAPQCTQNEKARRTLGEIADLWLMNDRPIVNRVDDSVVRFMAGEFRVLRRARGYAPAPLALPAGFVKAPAVLALGGDLKNTFCLIQEDQAVVSSYIGELRDATVFQSLGENLELFKRLYDFAPEKVAVDLHPDYLATKYRRILAGEGPFHFVQHHHAHIAACLGECDVPLESPPVLGLALDGLGFGLNARGEGELWGGEFLKADYRSYQRLGHFAKVSMPGGDRASREPWRNLVAHLVTAGLWEDFRERYSTLSMMQFLATKNTSLVQQMIQKGLNSPPASSAGRLFDAVSAALGIFPDGVSYEGQAAILLEASAEQSGEWGEGYPVARDSANGQEILSWAPLWQALFRDLGEEQAPEVIAARFHRGLVDALVEAALSLAREHGLDTVVLSGGVFHNRLLLEGVHAGLEKGKLRVLSPRKYPAGDGGLSLGQALVAAANLL